MNELQGERIDIIPWTDDMIEFTLSALQPATVTKVILDEEGLPKEVVVPDEQFSLAIGRRGQNVRLASQLTGLDISIMTETDERERRQADVAERTQMLMDTIDIDEVFAHLLVGEGFDTLDYLASCEVEEIAGIEGVSESLAQEVQHRASRFVQKENEEAMERAKELGLDDSLAYFAGLTEKMLMTLAEEGIVTLKDFAMCADWELAGGYTVVNGKRQKDVGILEKYEVTLEEAQQLVMEARIASGLVDASDLEADEIEAEAEEEVEQEGHDSRTIRIGRARAGTPLRRDGRMLAEIRTRQIRGWSWRERRARHPEQASRAGRLGQIPAVGAGKSDPERSILPAFPPAFDGSRRLGG